MVKARQGRGMLQRGGFKPAGASQGIEQGDCERRGVEDAREGEIVKTMMMLTLPRKGGACTPAREDMLETLMRSRGREGWGSADTEAKACYSR